MEALLELWRGKDINLLTSSWKLPGHSGEGFNSYIMMPPCIGSPGTLRLLSPRFCRLLSVLPTIWPLECVFWGLFNTLQSRATSIVLVVGDSFSDSTWHTSDLSLGEDRWLSKDSVCLVKFSWLPRQMYFSYSLPKLCKKEEQFSEILGSLVTLIFLWKDGQLVWQLLSMKTLTVTVWIRIPGLPL